jgi:hypothetical protein
MFKTLIIGGVVGGLVAFLWTALSWTVLPWHGASLLSFTNEDAVAQAIVANAPEPGVYSLPNPNKAQGSAISDEAMLARMEKGPNMFAVVQLKGDPVMWRPMATGLLIEIFGAALITWLLMRTVGLGYRGRVAFVVLAGLAGAIVCELPDWNWWHFSTAYTMGAILDRVVAALLSGLVIAWATGRADRFTGAPRRSPASA